MTRCLRLAWTVALAAVAVACNEIRSAPEGSSEIDIPVPASVTLPAATPAAHPLHVVIVSIDTLRADHLSVYGYPRDTSPALERLARESVLFEQAFSQSPKTAESHMTLMTGLYPDAHGVHNWSERNTRLSDDIPTLARLLQRAGYRTEGYVGGGNVRPELGFDQGFDAYETVWGAAALFEVGTRVLERLAAAEARGDARPTLLFLHTFELHDPYTPPDAYAQRFVDPDYAGEIVHSREELVRLAGEAGWPQVQRAFWNRVDPNSPADRQHLRDLYDALVRYTDDQLAGFLQSLRRLGLGERTLVVVLSDHGEAFGERKGFRHNSVYQEVLHVPLLLRFPDGESDGRGSLAGRRVRATVRLLDVMPTLLARLGLAIPAHVQGRSLLPLVAGAEAEPRFVFSEWRLRGQSALRVDGWKYVRRGWREELYDLALDPGEQRNVAWRNRRMTARLRRDAEQLASASQALHAGTASSSSFGLAATTREELQALGYLVEGQEN